MKNQKQMVPPSSMIFVGDGEFELIGKEFKSYFVGLGNLRPHHRVLDVGCGIGRMAIPLTDYLSPEGGYWGFDIVPSGIEWCRGRISAQHPHFHFQHCDVFNQHYNKEGKVRAEEFRFPFEDGFFDFAYLTSVFTHMRPAAMENYLGEVARVLKPGGKCLITFFLLNRESADLILAGRSAFAFQHIVDDCLVANANDPEAAIAYKEQIVRQAFARRELRIDLPIHYGSWCKRDSYLSFQDIIIATKEGAGAA